MHVEQIRVDPDPYEPFRLSQGFRVGDLLFISGQAAIDERGEIIGAGDFDAQAEQTFSNLRARARGWRLVARAGRQGHDLPHRHGQLSEDRRAAGQVVYAAVPGRHDRRGDVACLPELEIEIEAIAVAG